MTVRKISFIGGGNMASALIGGLVQQGFAGAAIQVVDLSDAARARLQADFGVRAVAGIDDEVVNTDLLVLAVKPQQLQEVARTLVGRLGNAVVVSIAAGIRSGDLVRWLGGYARVVRAMPNTPALIGAGITGMFAAPEAVTASERDAAERVMRAVGQVVWVADEAQMDAVTAVSGSGPAYVFHFIEALEAAGQSCGFTPEVARQLAIQTVLGAARLAAESDVGPDVLRERVTSKGGTTAAALASFAQDDLLGSVQRAVLAAKARGRELGDELGRGN